MAIYKQRVDKCAVQQVVAYRAERIRLLVVVAQSLHGGYPQASVLIAGQVKNTLRCKSLGTVILGGFAGLQVVAVQPFESCTNPDVGSFGIVVDAMRVRVETWNLGKRCEQTCDGVVDVYTLVFASNPEDARRCLGNHAWYARL